MIWFWLSIISGGFKFNQRSYFSFLNRLTVPLLHFWGGSSNKLSVFLWLIHSTLNLFLIEKHSPIFHSYSCSQPTHFSNCLTRQSPLSLNFLKSSNCVLNPHLNSFINHLYFLLTYIFISSLPFGFLLILIITLSFKSYRFAPSIGFIRSR